jgi:hypothetical protein
MQTTFTRQVLLALLAGLGLTAAALLLSRWPALAGTSWWYPETDAYQLWVASLVGLTVASHRLWDRGPTARRVLGGLWLLVAVMVLAGLVLLIDHIVRNRTPGDLLQNLLLGSRRMAAGAPVYDLRGLVQSVNASPLALLLVRPLAALTDPQAIVSCTALSLLGLGLYLAAGWTLVRRIKGRLTLFDAGVVLAAATTFGALQRSWRLGQLDTLLLALLTWGLALMPPPGGRARGWISASAVALAAGLKVLPGLAAAPLLLQSLPGWRRRRQPSMEARGWSLRFVGAALVAALATLALAGPGTVVDFFRNVPGISESSTSGNNYALVARLATFNDRDTRLKHRPLPPPYPWLGRGIGATALVLMLWLSLRLRRARSTLLCAMWLCSVPLVSPVCWDIYMIWCGLLPWLVLWAHLSGSPALRGGRPGAALLGVATAASYYLLGAAGNTTYHDLQRGITIHLPLPYIMDELPVLGHLLLLTCLALLAWRSDRLRRAPGEPEPQSLSQT